MDCRKKRKAESLGRVPFQKTGEDKMVSWSKAIERNLSAHV